MPTLSYSSLKICPCFFTCLNSRWLKDGKCGTFRDISSKFGMGTKILSIVTIRIFKLFPSFHKRTFHICIDISGLWYCDYKLWIQMTKFEAEKFCARMKLNLGMEPFSLAEILLKRFFNSKSECQIIIFLHHLPHIFH